MDILLFLYVLGVCITATFLYLSKEDHPFELVIFCSVFYPVIFVLGVLTLVLMCIFAVIHTVTEAFRTVFRRDT